MRPRNVKLTGWLTVNDLVIFFLTRVTARYFQKTEPIKVVKSVICKQQVNFLDHLRDHLRLKDPAWWSLVLRKPLFFSLCKKPYPSMLREWLCWRGMYLPNDKETAPDANILNTCDAFPLLDSWERDWKCILFGVHLHSRGILHATSCCLCCTNVTRVHCWATVRSKSVRSSLLHWCDMRILMLNNVFKHWPRSHCCAKMCSNNGIMVREAFLPPRTNATGRHTWTDPWGVLCSR
jgi:hypothetical protein